MKPAAVLCALLLPFIAVAPLHAAEGIVVQSASVELRGTTLEFSMQADFPADDEMRSALLAGATVDFELEAEVRKRNDFWFDVRVMEASYRRELSWNAPSQRYVLREVAGGEQRTFAALEEALEAAGTVSNWSVDLAEQIDPDESHEVGVRARLRRGRMPSALKALTFWTRYWSRSEWYRWPLPR